MQSMGAIGAILLATTAAPVAAAAPQSTAPNLAACARPKTPNEDLQRKRPLAVPAGYRGIVKSDVLHYAISTLDGGTVCVDTSWMEDAGKFGGSADGRFLTFAWNGIESYGHILVDRSGHGQVVDTGVPPVASPSARLLAAVDQTESEFGSLSGLAIWRIEAVGIREVARVEDLPRMQNWRIDSWSGETCIALSAVDLEADDPRSAGRHRFIAKPGAKGWSVTDAPRGGCPSA